MQIGGNANIGISLVTTDPDGSLSAFKGQMVTDMTTGITWKNRNGGTVWDPIDIPIEYGDLVKSDFNPEMGGYFARAAVAGGTTAFVSSGSNRIGVAQIGVSAAGVDVAVIRGHNAGQGICFGGGKLCFRSNIQIVTLSDGVNNHTVRAGWGDAVSSFTDNTDGVYFECSLSGRGSNNWFLCTANNSVRTRTDTGIVATTGWVHLEIRPNAAGTSVVGYIDGVAVTPVTTNIPTSAGARDSTLAITIMKDLGATARFLNVDAISHWVVYSTPKFVA